MVGLKKNMQGVNHLTKAHGKSIRDDVEAKVPEFERDLCVKELFASKNFMQTVVLNALPYRNSKLLVTCFAFP
ncbi:hypothetical protein Tco_1524774 [Tanacetum coccineum]